MHTQPEFYHEEPLDKPKLNGILENNQHEFFKSVKFMDRYQWLTPIILPTWETEIGRVEVQGQPRPHLNQ
jgi:hypothetical protein